MKLPLLLLLLLLLDYSRCLTPLQQLLQDQQQPELRPSIQDLTRFAQAYVQSLMRGERVGKKQYARTAHNLSVDHTAHTTRFNLDDPAWREYLHKNGYAVIRNVASPAVLKNATQHLWLFLRRFGMKQGEPTTWDSAPISGINGIISTFGAGSSKFAWGLRSLPSANSLSAIHYTLLTTQYSLRWICRCGRSIQPDLG